MFLEDKMGVTGDFPGERFNAFQPNEFCRFELLLETGMSINSEQIQSRGTLYQASAAR
jgi:hypothetical protein